MNSGAQKTKSTCSYCGVGCGVIVEGTDRATLLLEGDPEHPVNQGKLCSKGLNLHHTVRDTSDRLLYPQMRWNKQGERKRVSWDTALDRAAAAFSAIIRNHGPDAVGFYVSGQLLTEEYYLVNKLTKGFLGTANIDTNSRLCMSSAVSAYKKSLGEDAVPVAYADIEAADCFFVAGANPAWCHPILFRRIEARRAENPNAKLIVVDPRRTESCEGADLHLQIAPGTDITLFHAIARVLIERGWIDQAFIERSTEGFGELRQRVFEKSVARSAEICRIETHKIELAARLIATSRTLLTFWAMGLNQSVVGVEKNLALINLNLLTGRIGRPGCGPFSLTGQPNAMGGREVGGLSTMLAAHRDLGNAEHRAQVAAHWGVPVERIPTGPGLTATEMFEALRAGRLRAIWIICTNPLVSLPDSRRVRSALRRAPFVVVQEVSSRADTIEYADLILPAAGWLEKEGTMTNSERRVTRLPRLLEPPGEALPDAEILRRFAHKMGYGDSFAYNNPGEIFREHALLTAGTNIDCSGLTYERLGAASGTGAQWPVPSREHPGTVRLFSDGRFYTPSGRAKFSAGDDQNFSEPVSSDFPLVLTTGRVRDQWHTMTRTGKVNRLGQHAPRPLLEMHPWDATALGLAGGDLAEIRSRRGIARLRVRLTPALKRGVVFAPMHWGRRRGNSLSRINNLTSQLFDPTSKEPDFKFSAVCVKKYAKARERILIVGAGAAAFAFIQEYRKQNTRDEIVVFSAEPDPFYNRILLPEYISRRRDWVSLQNAGRNFCAENNVSIRSGTAVVAIDRAARAVRDTRNESHTYDRLILATGSRARPLPLASDDQFVLRTRADADRIMAESGERVLIVGGGLLGLELADALLATGKQVFVVHRSARLLSRQLDAPAADLLATTMRRRGLELLLNDSVLGVFPAEESRVVYLASGARIAVDSVIAATGTEPNVDLAREAGLAVQYGVVVDERMNTSDPSIFAMGENAQFGRRLFGTTLAAQDQAAVVAGVLAGDPFVRYTGSIDLFVLKIEGLPLASMGKITRTEPDEEEIVFSDSTGGVYKKCVLRGDRLIGCILVGDLSDLGRFRELHESGTELGSDRASLLAGPASARAQRKGRPVCSCRGVGTGNLEDALAAGGDTVESLCEATGAGSGCGSCLPELRGWLAERTTVLSRAEAS